MGKIVSFFILVLIALGCDSISENEPSVSDFNKNEQVNPISASDNYAKQIILSYTSSDIGKIDSIAAFVLSFKPGGLQFDNWPIEAIQSLYSRLDTLTNNKPLFFADYFQMVETSTYPIWSANKNFQDSVFWKTFNYAGINMLYFNEIIALNKDCSTYLNTLFDSQKLTPCYKINFKNKSISDLNLIAGSIQNNNATIWFDSIRTDSLPYLTIKKDLNLSGLLIARPTGNHLTHLEAGADMVIVSHKSLLKEKAYRQTKNNKISFYKINDLQRGSHITISDYPANSFLLASKLHLQVKSTTLLNNAKKMLPFQKYRKVSIDELIHQKPSQKRQLLIIPNLAQDTLLFKLLKSSNLQHTLVVFSNPKQFKVLSKIPNLIFTLANKNVLKSILNGHITINGDLITESKRKRGHKLIGNGIIMLPAEYAFINSKTLKRIEKEVNIAINGKAFPGCQVLGIKDNVLIYNKAFGHTTYRKDIVLNEEHIFDLASLTKVLSTTLVAMKLWEDGYFNLSDSIGDYLPDSLSDYLPNGSSIKNITFQELLIHQSGLPAGFPVINYMRKAADIENRFMNGFCDYPYDNFEVEVAENLFLENVFQDSMWLTLNSLWIEPTKAYNYSDVNMNTLYFLLKRIIDLNRLAPQDLNNGNTFENYLYQFFYEPMELITTRYKPLKRFSKDRIVPTENDRFWRKQLLQGHVHDPNAALYGGIAGNAGLFSNAFDIGILLTMWQNGGIFKGKRYLKQETIEKFVSTQPNTHRGLGFNKRTFSNSAYAMASSADQNSYGHTGFTGTCFWVDPMHKISYIFLSNRVHPTVSNRIYEFNIRTRVHQVFYDAILK